MKLLSIIWRWLRHWWWVGLGIGIGVLFVCYPLFKDGFFPTLDDVQVVRNRAMYAELMKGQFPVRMVQDFGNGGGYLLFQFYSPFVYYLGSLFHFIGFSFVQATKLTFILGYFVAGFGSFLLFKRYGRIVTLSGSLLFLFSAFFNYEVYTRGTLGEFFAFALLPLGFWAFFALLEYRDLWRLFCAGLILGIVVISHSGVGLMFLGSVLLLSLFYFKDRSVVGRTGLSIVYGLGISAFFWLPVALETQFIQYKDTYLAQQSFRGNFLHLLELAQITPLHWAFKAPVLGFGLFTGVIVALIIVLVRRRQLKNEQLVYYSFSLFGVATFLIWNGSSAIWEHLSVLRFMQFPYRFILLQTISAVVLFSLALVMVKNRLFRLGIAGIVLLLSLGFHFSFMRPSTYTFFEDYIAEDICTTSSWAAEYLPRWVQTCLPKYGPQEYVGAIDGEITVARLSLVPDGFTSEIVVESEKALVMLGKYYYPDWQIVVDKKDVSASPYGEYGLIGITLARGVHEVSVNYTGTVVQRIGNGISLFSIILPFVVVFYFFIVRLRHKNPVIQ